MVRLYEAGGGKRRTTLHTALDVRRAWLSNILEEALEPLPFQSGTVELTLSPFQLLTLKLEC